MKKVMIPIKESCFLKQLKKIEKLVTDPNLERPAYNVLLKMSAVGNNF